MRKHLKILSAHIEWGTASMFIGLGSLVLALGVNRLPWWADCTAGLFVFILAIFAARGAYTQKSIDRIAQYDRDFKALKDERKKAATFLLKRGGKETDQDDVLDFFDSPLGNLTDRGYLDEKLVYDFFFEWIRGYWSACKGYVEAQGDRTKWSGFAVLYETVIGIHKRQPGSDKKELLTGDELREFLEWELE
ncbi:MAG: hypothetical protein ABSF38_12965 [Verrucomicrobiota bacterium]